MISRRTFLGAASVAIAATAARKISPPRPYGAIPSAAQLAWHEMEYTAFLHFTVNTFTDKEWGYGDEDPNIFQPSRFDADAIALALKSAGVAGFILTCKHHDGFCLWPTKTTDHSIRSSSWQGGKGDIVRSLSDAARRAGLKFGVYLSPWDRNNPDYGKPRYLEIYRQQLTELLTLYGPIFEVWHDGANGGDGYTTIGRQPGNWCDDCSRRPSSSATSAPMSAGWVTSAGLPAIHAGPAMTRWEPMADRRPPATYAKRNRLPGRVTAPIGCRRSATFRFVPAGSGMRAKIRASRLRRN
jgi:Alpha-L-fucosidase